MNEDMEHQSTYQPNQPYLQARVAETLNCIVPPANTTRIDGKLVLHIPKPLDTSQFSYHKYGNPEFLAALVSTYDLRMEYEMSNWAYYHRRTAQHILPFMLLGPMSFARDQNLVQEAGITMMVAVRSKKIAETRPALMDPSKFASAQGIQTATFDVDTPYDVSIGRSGILQRINHHLESSCAGKSPKDLGKVSGKVLVFCETGNERSPILPALYLMTTWGLDAFSAVQIVQSRRFGIGISPEMIKMLRDVQEILNAERQMAIASRSSTPLSSTAAQKRSLDEAYDADEGDHIHNFQFQGQGEVQSARTGVAPFKDSSAMPYEGVEG